MTGEQVGEQTQPEGDRPHDEVRQDLQRDDHRQQRQRDPLRNGHPLEVAEQAPLLDAHAVVEQPGEDGQAPGEPDLRERREHEDEELAEQVVDEDEAEDRDHVRQELLVVVPQDVARDGVSEHVVQELADEVALGRDDLLALAHPQPEPEYENRADDGLDDVVREPDVGPGVVSAVAL